MEIKSFKDLLVWQKAMDLAEETYRIVKFLPKDETFALSNQMRRSAISIPSNIAEGQSRHGIKEYINFLYIAKGSNAELFTQLNICKRIGYLTDKQLYASLQLSNEVGKMLAAMIKQLNDLTPKT
ncbi:MAG: four helix bundle protein [Clostridia bacterium]|nr:four helix bundle protein [Clostridia bacterium]